MGAKYNMCGTEAASDLRGGFFGGVRCKPAGGRRRPLLRRGYKGCGTAGRCGERTERCQWQKQRSERVAAVKISSVRRKAAQKFWAPQQGHRPLRAHNKRCGERKESPSHGFAVTAPFRQGGRGDGRGGLPRALCALAMTLLTRSAECGGTHGSRPTLY